MYSVLYIKWSVHNVHSVFYIKWSLHNVQNIVYQVECT